MLNEQFVPFPKLPRLNRDVVVTEKLDGTNAQIKVNDTGDDLIAGSRTRWITPENDNFGFARWAQANKQELLRLGPGSHFGEWWGAGIGRRYGMKEKRFSLFNTARWSDPATRPTCCDVVPVLWTGNYRNLEPMRLLMYLLSNGSKAAPGFMDPEGIVVFHTAAGNMFKLTFDDGPKGAGALSD